MIRTTACKHGLTFLAVALLGGTLLADDLFYIKGKEGTYYSSFTLARAAAKGGDTIVLMRDADTSTDGRIDFNYKKNLTLDLGGHTLMADQVSAISVQTGYTGTITNGTVNCGTGSTRTASGGRNGAIAIFDGTLNIRCTVTSGRASTALCDCMGTSTVNIQGGADVTGSAGVCWTKYFDSNPNLTVNISGGKVSTSSTFYGVVYIHTSDVTATVNVSGGEVSSGKRLVYVYYDTYTKETTVNTVVNATFTGGSVNAAENITFDPDHAVENVSVTSMTASNCKAKFKATDHLNIASGYKAMKIGDWYQIVDEGCAPIPAGGSGTKVEAVSGQANTYAVTPTGSSRALSVSGASAGDTFVIGADTVDSLTFSDGDIGSVSVVVKATNGVTIVNEAFVGVSGNTFDATLDATASVAVDGQAEKVPVTPTIDAFAVDAGAAVTFRAIPGLTYALKRGTAVGTYETPVAATCATAEDCPLTLSDANPPTDAAFYSVVVTK